jgi:Tfp pilus assembly PilM family ATPase
MSAPELRKSKAAIDGHPNNGPVTSAPDRPKVERIRPTRDYSIGRRLAFTIDEDSIQMAAARHIGPQIKLLDVSKSYFTAGSVGDDNYLDFLRHTIVDYMKQFGGHRPVVSLTLTGPQTALRTVRIPKVKGSDLDAALRFEAKRQVPFPVDDCWTDHRVTEEIVNKGQHHLKASILAATKVAVSELLAPFEELGLTVASLYHTQDVIGQLLAPLPGFDPHKQYTLIDIHRRSTEISYYCGSDLEFYHVSSLGSSFLANRSDPTVFEYFAESLATEIQNSLDYYGGQFQASRVQDIYIYGDLSYTDDLISMLGERFGFNFRRFPIEHLKFVKNQNLLFHDNVAVCLPAVAAATNNYKIANLLPTALKQKQARRKADRVGIACMIFLAFLFASHWLASVAALRSGEEHLAELERQSTEFQASEMFATYNNLKRRLAANQLFINKAQETPSYFGLNLKELSKLVPQGVRLYDLGFVADAPDRNYLLSGLITTQETPPEIVLAELVENLSASPFYDDVTIERHIKRHKPEGFVIDFNLSMTGVI